MKTPFLLSLLALLAAGVALGVSLTRRGPSSPQGGALPVQGEPEVDPVWMQRLEELELENRDLSQRLSFLEGQRPASDRESVQALATVEQLEALRAEVQAWLAGGAGQVQPDQLEGQVAEVLGDLRYREAWSSAAAKLEKRSAAREEELGGWSKWLALDEDQERGLGELMALRDERERETLAAWQSGLGEEAIQEMRMDAELEFANAALELLNPAQRESLRSKFGLALGATGSAGK